MTTTYKPYPAYKDSGVEWLGEIPEGWEVKKLKHLAKIKNGQDYKSVQSETGYPVFGSGGQFTFASQYLYDSESVLLGRKGTIDKPLYINEPFWTVDTMYYTEVKRPTLGKYLYYLALTIQFDKYSTNTALPSMTQEHLNHYSFSVPKKYEEQTQIANFLDHETARIDTLIAKQKKLIALLKEKRQAVISHAVTKGLNPDVEMKDSGVEWLGEVPAHWDVKPLKYLCSFKGGGTPTKDNLSFWENGTIPWISPKDMKTFWLENSKDKITEAAVRESSTGYIEPNNLIMVVRSGILQRTIPIAINQVRVTLNQDMKALMFNNLLKVEYAANFIKGNESSLLLELSKEGATVESIEQEYLRRCLFTIPPSDEQTKINQFLSKKTKTYSELINKSIYQINLLKERRTALISAAVTGKIDLRDWQAPQEQNAKVLVGQEA